MAVRSGGRDETAAGMAARTEGKTRPMQSLLETNSARRTPDRSMYLKVHDFWTAYPSEVVRRP